MLNTRGLSSHRTGVESLKHSQKTFFHNRKAGGRQNNEESIDGFLDDATKRIKDAKGRLPSFPSLAGFNLYAVLRVASTILHVIFAVVVLIYWGTASGDARKAPLLKTHAFFTTDYSSMMDTIANTGVVPLPTTGSMSMMYTIAAHAVPGMKALVNLDKSGMLTRAQPVMIRSKTGNSSAFVPDRCMAIALVDNNGVAIPGTTNTSALDHRDYASWRACRSSNAPMLMMDMPYPYTTMTFFGTNNMLGLIYNTLLITAAISIAMLPWPDNWGSVFNIWVVVAELLLMGNFIGMMAIPFTNLAMHMPPNNAILISVFHLITMVVILALARPRDEERSVNPGKKGELHKWEYILLKYIGTRLVRGGNYGNMGAHMEVYQRASTGQVVCLPRGEFIAEKGDGEKDDDIPEGIPVGDDGPKKPVGGIVNTENGYSIAALIPGGTLEDDFADFLINRMSMITVRYFEYSMTAGLFLVAILIVLYPTADVFLYHIVFQGMMMCNLVAIPLSKGIVGSVRVFSKLGINNETKGDTLKEMYYHWLPFGMVMMLISSCFFFVASFAPFCTAIWGMIFAGNSGVPDAVRGVIITVMVMFILFAVIGAVFICLMISRMPRVASTSASQDAHGVGNLMKWQLCVFEILNWFKWAIASVVVASVLNQTGL